MIPKCFPFDPFKIGSILGPAPRTDHGGGKRRSRPAISPLQAFCGLAEPWPCRGRSPASCSDNFSPCRIVPLSRFLPDAARAWREEVDCTTASLGVQHLSNAILGNRSKKSRHPFTERVLVGYLRQRYVTRMPFDQGGDVAVLWPGQEIALPMTGYRPIFYGCRSLAN